MSYETEYVAATIAALTAEITTLRARLETVEAETRERCAKVAEQANDVWEDASPAAAEIRKLHQSEIAQAIRNLEPRQ